MTIQGQLSSSHLNDSCFVVCHHDCDETGVWADGGQDGVGGHGAGGLQDGDERNIWGKNCLKILGVNYTDKTRIEQTYILRF